MNPVFKLTWEYAENNIGSLKSVPGGYSNVKKGLLELPDGTWVFVKKGIDPQTNMWTKKEVTMYQFLSRHNYPHIPKVLAVNSDQTGFVLEAITTDNGWTWDDIWDDERLDVTFGAMNDLANISLSGDETEDLKTKSLSEEDDGWAKLARSADLQTSLRQKLMAIARQDVIDLIKVNELANQSAKYVFKNDTLVHNDIRADNCAWNSGQKQVCLIDWNWAQIGDKRIDTCALLVNIQKSGFNILSRADRLDHNALVWLAGFWLAAASAPLWPNDPNKLRDSQLRSGLTALELSTKI